MINYVNHLMRKLPYELLLFAFAFGIAAGMAEDKTKLTCIIAALVLVCCFFLAIIRYWLIDHNNDALLAHDRVEAFEQRIRDYMKAKTSVDIWQYQEGLMRASDQKMPELPQIHKNVLLYAALQAEELSETYAALAQELEADTLVEGLAGADGEQEEQESSLQARILIAQTLRGLATELYDKSLAIRGHLSYISDDWFFTPTRQGAKDLLDGASDVAVVTAGFGLAAGLPVRQGYDEVGSSNLSKANPVTGKIDKDSGGKWIKGMAYREPDLFRVLAAQRGAYEASQYWIGENTR